MPNEQKSGNGGPFHDGSKVLEITMNGTSRTLFIFIDSVQAEKLKTELEDDLAFQKKKIKVKIIEQEKIPVNIVIRRFMTLELKGSKYSVFVKAGMIRKKGSPDQLN